jgi:hypothetical protein
MAKTNVDRLRECFGRDGDVHRVTYQGRLYAVTTGTGEGSYGSELGGSCAFAYAASELRAATLRAGDDWDYSEWCREVSTVEDKGLARKLARLGMRLTRGGSCAPVLSDAEFARSAAEGGAL